MPISLYEGRERGRDIGREKRGRREGEERKRMGKRE